jgi:hypothetical protein
MIMGSTRFSVSIATFFRGGEGGSFLPGGLFFYEADLRFFALLLLSGAAGLDEKKLEILLKKPSSSF